MSGVFCLLFCLFAYPDVTPPVAAAHLHRGVGELALVGALQCGQRGNAAENHSVQRAHSLTHHQGASAQWSPETGTDRTPLHSLMLHCTRVSNAGNLQVILVNKHLQEHCCCSVLSGISPFTHTLLFISIL